MMDGLISTMSGKTSSATSPARSLLALLVVGCVHPGPLPLDCGYNCVSERVECESVWSEDREVRTYTIPDCQGLRIYECVINESEVFTHYVSDGQAVVYDRETKQWHWVGCKGVDDV